MLGFKIVILKRKAAVGWTCGRTLSSLSEGPVSGMAAATVGDESWPV